MGSINILTINYYLIIPCALNIFPFVSPSIFFFHHCLILLSVHALHMFQFSSIQFSRSVVSDFLQPHGLQHARPPCPSPAPRVYSDSCPVSRWCHPTISSFVIPFPPIFIPSIRVFSNESVFRIKWPNYWGFSFNISPFNEHPGPISFRMDWLDLFAVQRTLKHFLHTTVQKHQFFSAQLSL